jgi:hypothetical protein
MVQEQKEATALSLAQSLQSAAAVAAIILVLVQPPVVQVVEQAAVIVRLIESEQMELQVKEVKAEM